MEEEIKNSLLPKSREILEKLKKISKDGIYFNCKDLDTVFKTLSVSLGVEALDYLFYKIYLKN